MKVEYTLMDKSTFKARLEIGQKFEKRVFDLFNDAGYTSGIYEFVSAMNNATQGDGWVTGDDGRTINWEAKFTSRIALKSINRFSGNVYIMTPFNNFEDPETITAEKVYVIAASTVKNYADKLVVCGKTFQLPSGDEAIELNLGQWISSKAIYNMVTLEKYMKDGLAIVVNY